MDAKQIFNKDLESGAIKSAKFLGPKQNINKWHIVTGNLQGDICTFKYDKKNGISTRKFHVNNGESISCLDASEDGSLILAATNRGTIGRIRLGQDNNHDALDIVHGLGSTANSIHFIPNTNERAIIGTRSGSIAQFNVERNETDSLVPTAHRRNPITEALPLSASILLTASTDNTARILDLRVPTIEYIKLKHNSWVYSASAASAESTMVLTGCRQGQLHLWDIRNPSQPISNVKAAFGGGVTSCVIEEVQNIAIAGSSDHTASVLDLETGALRFHLRGFENGIKRLTLSKNRQLVLGCAFDGHFRIYDIGFPVRRNVSVLTKGKSLPDDLDSAITEFLW